MCMRVFLSVMCTPVCAGARGGLQKGSPGTELQVAVSLCMGARN